MRITHLERSLQEMTELITVIPGVSEAERHQWLERESLFSEFVQDVAQKCRVYGSYQVSLYHNAYNYDRFLQSRQPA